MNAPLPVVRIVDDDASFLKAVARMLRIRFRGEDICVGGRVSGPTGLDLQEETFVSVTTSHFPLRLRINNFGMKDMHLQMLSPSRITAQSEGVSFQK